MYERSYGKRYGQVPSSNATDIAKVMREDIKKAITAGKLPGKSSNYSVRIEKYSGGQSINITAIDLPGMYQVCDGTIPGTQDVYQDEDGTIKIGPADHCQNHYCKAGGSEYPSAGVHDILTVEGQRVDGVLEEIHEAYNHDGTNSQIDYFDVLYYGDVEIETPSAAEFRLREKARRAAKRAARKARSGE